MKPINNSKNAILYLILTAALWSTSGLWIKVISWSPLAILGGRSFIAFFVFLIFLRKIKLSFSWLQLLGSICYVLTQFTFVWATKLTTAANAIFLQYASPIYVVILGYIFLRERPQKADWIAMLMIFSGLFLFFGDKLTFDGIYGNILAIISGMTFSVVMLVMRFQKDNNPAQIILVGNLIGFLVGLPYLQKETFSIANIAIILYLGIFQIGLSFVFYSKAIQHVKALESNLILALEPILNPVWVFLVLGEKPAKLALIGSVLVITAILFRAYVTSQDQLREANRDIGEVQTT